MTLAELLKEHQAATDRNDQSALQRIEKAYLRILEDHPDSAEVLQLLGTLYMQIHKNPLAIQLLERCISIKPKTAEAWNNLGNAYRIDHHTDRAERAYAKAVECAPQNGENWNNWGTNYVNEGKPEEGERILTKATELSPNNEHAWWNLSLVKLEQGKYDEGFNLYDHGKKAKVRFERFYCCPEWDGKETDHLILYGEQGMGDEVMYMTLIPLIKNAKKITIDCHPRLINMFKRSYPDIDFYPTRKDRVIDWARDKTFTARCALGDLGKHYIKTAKDFPKTVFLDPDKTKEISLSEGVRVGISWEGGKKKTRNDLRSVPLEEFASIIKSRPDIHWVSLQYTPKSREVVKAFNDKHGTNVAHYSYVHEFDYDWTLSLASKMDLVITVNTSLVHLCGAAGIPAWVLTPFGKAWRYYTPDAEHMSWYGDHVRLYQQGIKKQWEPVLKRVRHDLKKLKGKK